MRLLGSEPHRSLPGQVDDPLQSPKYRTLCCHVTRATTMLASVTLVLCCVQATLLVTRPLSGLGGLPSEGGAVAAVFGGAVLLLGLQAVAAAAAVFGLQSRRPGLLVPYLVNVAVVGVLLAGGLGYVVGSHALHSDLPPALAAFAGLICVAVGSGYVGSVVVRSRDFLRLSIERRGMRRESRLFKIEGEPV